MDDPLIEALESLRQVDADFVARHPYTADDILAGRMRTLRLTLAALGELQDRGDELTPEAVRHEMGLLDEVFFFEPSTLLEFAEGFRDDGDDQNAETCARAYSWHTTRRTPEVSL